MKAKSEKKFPSRPRIADIAVKAGVSYTTASYILSGRHKKDIQMKAETIEKVENTAKELGYRPNHAARSLASLHSRIMYIIVHDLRGYPAQVIDSALAVLKQQGYQAQIFSVHYDSESEKKAIQTALETNAECVALCTTNRSHSALKELQKYNIPYCYFESYPSAAKYSVGTDEYFLTETLVNYLTEKRDCRTFHYIDNPDTRARSTGERYLHFCNVLEKRGLHHRRSFFPEGFPHNPDTYYTDLEKVVEEILETPETDAIVSFTYTYALALEQGLRLAKESREAKKRFNECDSSIVTGSKIPILSCFASPYNVPFYTLSNNIVTVIQDWKGMGEKLADLMIRLAEQDNTLKKREEILIPGTLLIPPARQIQDQIMEVLPLEIR